MIKYPVQAILIGSWCHLVDNPSNITPIGHFNFLTIKIGFDLEEVVRATNQKRWVRISKLSNNSMYHFYHWHHQKGKKDTAQRTFSFLICSLDVSSAVGIKDVCAKEEFNELHSHSLVYDFHCFVYKSFTLLGNSNSDFVMIDVVMIC